MDSITQIVLGAAVGEAALGSRVGRKAAFWGAVCGTLPDLDVLVPFADPVSSFTYHRSFSHSLLVLALVTPLMVWLIRKLHPQDAGHRGWYALVYLSFATHVLLDSLTIYGTQIFWPIVSTPVSTGAVFIIDPLYTLPLMAGLGVLLLARNKPRLGHRANALALAVSTGYLVWGLAAKWYVHNVAENALANQGLAHSGLVTLAAPFTTLLWRVVAMHDGGYRGGWYSLIEGGGDIQFTDYPSEPQLLQGMQQHWPVQRLKWFTKGFYSVNQEAGNVLITDLRMGVPGSYVFRFKVAEIGNPHPHPVPSELISEQADLSRVGELWALLLGANQQPNPPPL